MLHAGLDLSRKKLDVCLLSDQGEHLDQLVVAPDVDSLRRFARRIEEVHCQPVSAVIESMTGARIVHDTLEQEGWSVEIADAQKVKGLAPLACKTDNTRGRVTSSPDGPPLITSTDTVAPDALTIDSGWREVADKALAFVKQFV